jgi:HKD family nuclease/predicted house-cleaning noncanonical NTP pyrophosphatase (MazG superfamily)
VTPRSRERLIRDRIPDLAAAQGRRLALRTAEPAEMARLLGLKLVEETHEVLDAIRVGRPGEVLDELADLQTVIDAIAARHGLSRQDVDRRAEEKRAQRGGFDSRLVLQDAPPAPGRLHVGGGRSLLDALKQEFEACAVARIAVAFVMNSGLDLIEGPALAALLRGADLKLLTTDYLGVTEPEALERLSRWRDLEAKVYSHRRRSFHPKAYLFERGDGSGRAFIGSANLSRMGLTEGVEWTWTVLDVDAGEPMHELTTRFEELFDADESQALSPGWIRDYAQRRIVQGGALVFEEPRPIYQVELLEPREVQKLALRELERLRQDGETRALVVAATGLGKTFLAAFDARAAERVLFIAHREELLRQAEDAFERVYPARTRGWLADGRAELDRDVVFASIQTLSRPEHLARPELARFDHVVVDEFHHAAADTYQRVLQALSPRFLLGLTATPFRADQRDLLSLCNGNLAYQVGLLEAIAFGWLVPFRYHGIADVVAYTDDLLTARKTYDTTRLTLRFNTEERADLVMRHYRAHAGRAALGFCVSIDHADFMSAGFAAAGVAAAAVHSGNAARTIGLLAVKLPVSSNSRNTSTMVDRLPAASTRHSSTVKSSAVRFHCGLMEVTLTRLSRDQPSKAPNTRPSAAETSTGSVLVRMIFHRSRMPRSRPMSCWPSPIFLRRSAMALVRAITVINSSKKYSGIPYANGFLVGCIPISVLRLQIFSPKPAVLHRMNIVLFLAKTRNG